MLHADGDFIHVRTARLRFTIQRRGWLVTEIESLVGRRWRPRAGELDLAMDVQRDGVTTRHLASRDETRTIEVESEGPLRACVVLRGLHRAEGGQTFGPYTLRLTILADQPRLILTHSIVFDGQPERDFVRSSEVLLRATVGVKPTMGFGCDDGAETRFDRQRAGWAPDFRHAELFQDSPTHWRLSRWVDPDRREVFTAEGLQADGWMELAGDDGRVAAVVPEFARQHPKALRIDAATGLLTAGLYPARAPRLDLQRYSDVVYPMTYEAPCTWKDEVIPFDAKFNAHGIRKTHDLAFLFDEMNPASAARRINRPLRLEWPPAHTARTGVVVPASGALDAAWTARTHRYLDLLVDAATHDGGTGYLDYFDLPMGYNTVEGRWTHDYGGHGYINDEAMPCLGLWQAYLLTGRLDALDLAKAMTRHNADIDSHHLGPFAGYGSRHNVNHWGDMCKEPRIAQPIGKRLIFYLTGDRSVHDLVRVMLARFERDIPAPTKLGTTAYIPALVATLLFAEETGLWPCADWLGRLADAIADSVDVEGSMYALTEADMKARSARALPDSGHQDYRMFSCFGGPQAFAELAERLDHGRLREALVRMARYRMRPHLERAQYEGRESLHVMADSLNVFRSLDLLGYAHQVTGDEAIARHVKRLTRTIRVEVEEQPVLRFGKPSGRTRPKPVESRWPDDPPEIEALIRQYRPIPHAAGGQLFEMAVYLHKMQAIMRLCAKSKR
ncbi:MAG: hypothetical protein NTW19_20635 [Planctomycetota bacterium]|nr:hypothetical protein [Planctomycetota bacterium]